MLALEEINDLYEKSLLCYLDATEFADKIQKKASVDK
jgi:hypothetical protein